MTLLTGRRAWLTTGALSVVLTGALVQQLVPTAASAAPAGQVSANAADTPTVVDPSPDAQPTVGPVVPVAPAAAPAAPAVVPAAAPVTPPAPAPKKKAAPATPARKAAPTGDVCSGTGWQQKRGSRALASLRHPTPAGVTVAFKGARSGYLGLTYPARRHVDMFVRSCSAEPFSLLRHVMAHEMGHAYDAAHMTAASRASWMALRGIPAGTPWFGCSYCSDFATPAGDFAEVYAQWQRGASTNRSTIAGDPSAAVLARLAATFFTR